MRKYRREEVIKIVIAVVLSVVLVVAVMVTENMSVNNGASGLSTAAAGGGYVAGTYTGYGEGFGGSVSVTITVDDSSITDVTATGDSETDTIGGAALDELAQQVLDAQSADIDGVSGATFTSDGIRQAAQEAIDQAVSGEETSGAAGNAEVTYSNPGTYSGTGSGYKGDVVLDVTFSEDGIEDIQVAESSETAHVGDVAYDILFADAMEANGAGIDSVSGATFTSRAIKEALKDAADQAGVSDAAAFASNTVVHAAQADIEETYDVVVVGGGGAGMATAAQAAQNGDTVLVIEENAEVGGNTLVSGGAFQSVMPYLVWDPEDPDATTAVWDYDGQTYDKVMSTQGNIDVLKTILNWSEEPFDEDYYTDHEFVAGDIEELSQHGVHEEYLSTLQALKAEIQAYLDWAQPKLDAGEPESAITLFSTVNLHIFQTYYGGLRPNADNTEWIYGDYDLVSQFITEGQDLKTWLEDQGSDFNDATQTTLIGALWYRENTQLGADLDGDGEDEETGNWGAYFVPLENTILNDSPTAAWNKIMTRTTAENLLMDDDGNVIGVQSTMYDGTTVISYANKGVVLATGGYAANIDEVIETNEYWDAEYITSDTDTTNRSSLQGDGIVMAEEAGADTVGEGWTQMMPISWIDNGDLAFGGGTGVVYINPTTGTRFVNESAERDVLSWGEFRNGITVNGTQGVFLEFSNENVNPGVGYSYELDEEVDGRVYLVSNEEELQEVLDEFGMEADPADIYATIEAYDRSIMAGEQPSDGIEKSQASDIIGDVEKDDEGNYIEDTYDLDGATLRIRVMAPSTHHTMGGVSIDTERHVLTEDGSIISGLYAAGEVTGGIHGGNRLGGNAIVEILVSGRIAANTIHEEHPESTLPEGTTYEGVGEGRNGDIKVAVTVDDDGVITDITVLESEETDGVGTIAYDEMIPLMVSNNSIAVDTVSSATLTSNGLLEAVSNALIAGGLDPADYQGEVTVARGEDQEYDVDVVIVGGGGAGLAAAASASEAGASVIVLEKTAAVGGNTKLGEGTYDSADPDLLQAAADAGRDGVYMTDNDRAEVEEALAMDTDGNKELEDLIADVIADYEAWEASGSEIMFDSVNWHALQTYIGGGCIDNIELIRKYADEAPTTLEWLEDEIGIPFKNDYIFMAIGGKWTRGHQIDMVAATGAEGDNGGSVYISKLEEYDEAHGVNIICNAQVTKLLVNDELSAVTGCVAERNDGSTITVNADSVILTTGGYGANQDLVLEYSNGTITTTLHSCAVSSTGDGLALAEDVGASLLNLDQIQVHPLGDPIDDCGCVSEFVGNWMSATEYMFVNKEGKRFINEDATRAEISAAELQQTDGQMWLIVDSSTITDEVMADREDQINSLLADGHSYVADTIEELAEEIGVDADTLQATIDQYNEYMTSGSDEDFGKVASADYTIEAGPFYASLRTPTVHYTMGGIEINTDTQVIDTDGNPIAGLYAAGEVATGIHGNNRLGGNAYPDIMTFGKIAGEQAAAYSAAQ